MLLGLGWPQWLLIIALVGGLLLTFKVMARASVAYEKARQRREALQGTEGIAASSTLGGAEAREEEGS